MGRTCLLGSKQPTQKLCSDGQAKGVTSAAVASRREGQAKGPAVWEGDLTCGLWGAPGVRAQGPAEASVHAMTLEVTRTLPCLTVTAVTT